LWVEKTRIKDLFYASLQDVFSLEDFFLCHAASPVFLGEIENTRTRAKKRGPKKKQATPRTVGLKKQPGEPRIFFSSTRTQNKAPLAHTKSVGRAEEQQHKNSS
jgi:hypothetical protein